MNVDDHHMLGEKNVSDNEGKENLLNSFVINQKNN